MKKFASDAGSFLNRAKQYTEEKLGQAEKTEYEPAFEQLMAKAEKTRIWTEKIVKQTEALLQPNPALRVEQFISDKIQSGPVVRHTETEIFGQNLVEAGNDIGPGTSYGSALLKCGQIQQKLAEAEGKFIQSSVTNFLVPLKNFLEGDIKALQKEKKSLETRRLDLDAAKTKLKRTKPENKDPVETELRVAQVEFDRQVDATRVLLERIAGSQEHHLRNLSDFITGQAAYYAQCNQCMVDLQQQLGR